MIIESTYILKKKTIELINDNVGKPYSLLQSIKMKGIGCKRMVIDEVSPSLIQYVNQISDLNYANIELRSKGILIYINQGLKNFTWAIPFYQLVVYKVNGTSIHAQGKFIHFRNNKTFKENKAFFAKLLDEKVKYDEQYNFNAM